MFNRKRLDIHRRTVASLPAVLVLGLVGCAQVPGVYVYEAPGAAAASVAAFDAVAYVEGIWSSQVLPTVQEKAVDAPTLLAALGADPAAAGAQYGRQAGTGGPYAYLVEGSGTVSALDTAAPSGPITVEVGTPDAPRQIAIATGPVLAGTALRDAVGFIDFGQFTNQLDYADAARQLNEKAKTDVIAKVDRAALVGRRVTFSGAFAALPGAPTVLVVPTTLEVAP